MRPQEQERASDLITDLVEDAGLEVLKLTISVRRNVILTLDKDPGTVTMDDCANINRAIRRALEEARFDVDDYSIEVESPGTKRILNQIKHFERFIGERALARLKEQRPDGQRVVRGIIERVEDDHFVIQPEVGGPWKLSLDECSGATLDPRD